ncbi:MAG: lamin tail domain-containing protein [Planctomycetota bacterium]
MRKTIVVLGLVFSLCVVVNPTSGEDIVISEIRYHPPSYLEGEEFFELRNVSATAVNLSGWYFHGVDLVFSAGTSIAAGGYLVLAADAAQFQSAYGFAPDAVYSGRLSNDGELLELFNAAGALVDQVSYRADGQWPITPDGGKPSLEVIDPLQDNSTPRNWRAAVNTAGHTARAINSVNAVGLPPWISDVQHTVGPQPYQPIIVTAEVQNATDVSLTFFYNFTENAGELVVAEGDQWRYFKGTAPPSDPIGDWTQVAFPDSAWQIGPSGFGYGDADDSTDLSNNPLPPTTMQGSYLSVYVRHKFQIDYPETVAELILSVDYDDAYVAYINGVEVARSDNIAGNPPGFDTPASVGHEASGGDVNPQPPDVRDISAAIPYLLAGTNVLAVQGHNLAIDNNDFSLIPELSIVPGLSLLDDGQHNDGAAGDGVYGATIPGQPANTLVRYRIEAYGPTGIMAYPRSDDTIAYDGTVVTDPALSSALPIIHWFMRPEDYQEALNHRYTDETEPAVFYYDGMLFDNSAVHIRGGASRSWAKANWKVLLPQGHELFDPELLEIPVDQFCLQCNYADKSYTRTTLGYETFREIGASYSQAFPVRLQQNGQFYGLYTYTESTDDDYIERNGLDKDAAWYKTQENRLCDCRLLSLASLPSYYIKHQRLDEGYNDLYDFLYSINNLTGQARKTYLFDNVDLSSMINYVSGHVLIHHTDRSWHNYFLYRDTEGTQRWTMQAYDMDLTLGRNACPLFNDDPYGNRDPVSHPLVNSNGYVDCFGAINYFVDALLTDPDIRQMYFRRLRTVMDKVLTPGYYEGRLTQLQTAMAPEAVLDVAKWGQYGQPQTLSQAIDILKNSYLVPRRTHLFVTHRVPGEIPAAQSAYTPIVISEIMYHPATDGEDEFLELYNPSLTEAVDLSNWRIDGVGLRIPSGTVILPNDYLVVVRNDVRFRSVYGSGHFLPAQYDGALDNAAETISLFDENGNLVDVVGYGDAAPWPVSPDGGGPSLELIDLTKDNNRAANWAPSTVNGGTPDGPNTRANVIEAFPTLYVSEVLPQNVSVYSDEEGEFDPWIEIYNAGTATIDLGGMFLTDDYLTPNRWEIPAGTSVCGKNWRTFWADSEPAEGALHASFSLGSVGGSIGLYSASGVLVDFINYPVLPADVSHGKFPDVGPLLRDFLTPTPSGANAADLAAVFLNEYNAVRPDRLLEGGGADIYWGSIAGNGGDWFELVVAADHVDMRGWQLVVSDDTGSAEETIYTLMLTSAALWSDIRSGTIITVSEDLASDVGYNPAAGDWWINVQAATGGQGTYITASDFEVSNSNWQVMIMDNLGRVVFGPAGEGIQPASGIGNDEVFKLEEDPSISVTQFSNYNDGSSSTFGAPNIWSAGTITQDFIGLRRLVSCVVDSDCADGNPCTQDDCNAGLCVNAPSAGQCNDGDPCTTNDACVGGACLGTSIPNCCQVDCDCDDGNSCTSGTCASNTCQYAPLDDGEACEDGDYCTANDTCTGGVCAGGPVDCSFLNDDCNVGSCSAEWGVCIPVARNEGGACNDGLVCTVNDLCRLGLCLGTDNCAADRACDPATDQCALPGSATALPVEVGDDWRYYKGTEQPPLHWTSLFFDDSSWATGLSGIGAGDGDDATELTDMQGNYLTVYGRRLFHLSNPGVVIALTLTVDFDDGMVAYLNGHEVARSNVHAYPARFDSPAAAEHEASGGDVNPNPPEVFELLAFTPLLRPGTNVLAIQGHNRSLESDDFSLIPRLEVTVSSAPPAVEAVGARYLAITPPPDQPSLALQVGSGVVSCLPQYVDADGYLATEPVFQSSEAWGTVFVGGAEIIPRTSYAVRADVRDALEPENLSEAVFATTWAWGDTNGVDNVNVFDIVCVLDGFNDIFTRCTLYGNDLNGAVPGRLIDVFDIVGVLDGFQGLPYPRVPCSAGRAVGGVAAATSPVVMVVPKRTVVRPGGLLAVDVYVGPVHDVRGYQVLLEVRGDDAGHIELESIAVDTDRSDYVFRGLMSYPTVAESSGRLANAALDGGVSAEIRTYLGTYTFRVSKAYAGERFQVAVRLGNESVFVDSANEAIGTVTSHGAEIYVVHRLRMRSNAVLSPE